MQKPTNTTTSRAPANSMLATDERLDQLKQWLQTQSYQDFSLKPASQDASFRRYFRMTRNGQKSLIIMDAPPHKESLSPFIEIAQDWGRGGIAVPTLYEYSREYGFLVLEDFGSSTMLNILNEQNLLGIYKSSIGELIRIQSHKVQYQLPRYSKQLLLTEMQLFIDWFLAKHCAYSLTKNEEKDLHELFSLLKDSAFKQQQVTVHRDYHSRNLMHRPDKPPGVIDFQDAVQGPMTYDLVSLLKDCYIKLDNAQRESLFDYYLTSASEQGLLVESDTSSFKQDFDWMGMQRHLKAIGIFARLYYRDGKTDYIKDIPRTASYIMDLANVYPQLAVLTDILSKLIPQLDHNGEHQQ